MVRWLGESRSWLSQDRTPEKGSESGVRIIQKGPNMAAEKSQKVATENGVYEMNGARFRIKAGAKIPEGGKFMSVDKATAFKPTESPKKNKKPAAGAPGANAASTGPAEAADSTGPQETNSGGTPQ